MTIAQSFNKFLENIKVDNSNKISDRYHEITKKLNKTFRDTDSEVDNCLRVGSYGRYTGIKGISDLDMLYIMPSSKWDEYKNDSFNYILIAEENGVPVSSVQMSIVRSLTHNVRPFAVIENVVTHADHRKKGYASALLRKATDIAKAFRCYKISLETGSNRESTLNFYRQNGFAIDEKHSCLKRLD